MNVSRIRLLGTCTGWAALTAPVGTASETKAREQASMARSPEGAPSTRTQVTVRPKSFNAVRRTRSPPQPVSSTASGGGTSVGADIDCTSASGSVIWNAADRLRMAPFDWRATTRRVAKDRPLRIRSTSKRTGSRWVPPRMK